MADTKPQARRVPARKSSPDQPGEAEKPQRERFIEAAREAGVTEEGFEWAMDKVARPKKHRPETTGSSPINRDRFQFVDRLELFLPSGI